MANIRLANSITAHAWNADCSSASVVFLPLEPRTCAHASLPTHSPARAPAVLALSPNTSEVWIYSNCHAEPAAWERSAVLRQHDLVVSAIDWHPATNKIVTCSHDRSAFVWVLAASGEWTPQVVILPHRMACMDVRWSPDGLKFAVASGSKKALIAYFDAANTWWVAREARKHKSTVLAVAWHPSSQVLATVATDYTCRVVAAHVEGVDAARAATPFGALPEAGEVITEFEITRAWVNDVAWSPSGRALAFAGHDSLLHLVTFGSGEAGPLLQTIKCPTLPAMRLTFLSETALVTAGHSMNPELYVCSAGAGAGAGAGAAAALPLWTFASYLDKRPEAGAGAKAAGGVAAARAPRATTPRQSPTRA